MVGGIKTLLSRPAYSFYVFAERLWDASSFSRVFESLCACFAASWCSFVACHAILARWLELWVGVVGPDVCWFHARVAVLAIGDGVAFHALHDGELAEHAAWVFYEPVFWFEFADQALGGQDEVHAVDGFLCSWRSVWSLPVVSHAGDAEARTWGASPDDIGVVEWCWYLVFSAFCC